MNLDDCVKKYQKDLKNRAVTFLIANNKLLLIQKKEGFGMGYWIGAGGRQEEGELIQETAKREYEEELKTEIKSLKLIAEIEYYFPTKAEPLKASQRVYFFSTDSYDGEPTETEEAKPKWFELNEIPYSEMWDDYNYWFKIFLQGNYVEAKFMYNADNKIEQFAIKGNKF